MSDTITNAAAAAAPHQLRGAVIGLVTDVEDPDGLGRVEISLPWFAGGYRAWARVAHLSAGPGYGSTWVPEVDGEVLVVFGHGDLRFPFVIGCLYNAVDQPPESRTASSDVRTITTPKGLEIRFDETEEVVTLTTASGASVRLEEKEGAVTVEATSSITLKATDITLEASGSVTVKGSTIALN